VKRISLTQGQFAVVDDADYEVLIQWKWQAVWRPGTRSFYAKRRIELPRTDRRRSYTMYMARQIMGNPPGKDVDHRNHDTLDNRRLNLRVATHQENLLNKRPYFRNMSGYKGVCAARNRWRAEICLNGHRRRLGHFDTPELAHAAYVRAARKYHGEFAFVGGAQ
jgi:hypothetical protein